MENTKIGPASAVLAIPQPSPSLRVIAATNTVLGAIINQGNSMSTNVPTLKPTSIQTGQRPSYALAAIVPSKGEPPPGA